jgi:hypothetical protein
MYDMCPYQVGIYVICVIAKFRMRNTSGLRIIAVKPEAKGNVPTPAI